MRFVLVSIFMSVCTYRYAMSIIADRQMLLSDNNISDVIIKICLQKSFI